MLCGESLVQSLFSGYWKGTRVRRLWRREREKERGGKKGEKKKGEAEVASSEEQIKKERGREEREPLASEEGDIGSGWGLSLIGSGYPVDRARQQNYNCIIPAFLL